MRLLLDTHIFLWYVTADPKLEDKHAALIRDSANDAFLSVASIWEAIAKHSRGKLPLPAPITRYVRDLRQEQRIAVLPLDEGSTMRLLSLPPVHRDPFDRMLVCQAIEHDLVLMTADRILPSYPVKILALE